MGCEQGMSTSSAEYTIISPQAPGLVAGGRRRSTPVDASSAFHLAISEGAVVLWSATWKCEMSILRRQSRAEGGIAGFSFFYVSFGLIDQQQRRDVYFLALLVDCCF